MKLLNNIIALLVLSIIVSGGYLGYMYFSKNTTDTTNDTENGNGIVTINPTPEPTENDPIADTGCSNLFVQGANSSGQQADIQLNFTSDSSGQLTTGDKIKITAEVLSTNPATTWNALALRMIYPCENLKLIRAYSDNPDYLFIPINSEYANVAGGEIGALKNNFKIGDKLAYLEFEVIEEGNITLEVADISSILDDKNQKYSIASNKINL